MSIDTLAPYIGIGLVIATIILGMYLADDLPKFSKRKMQKPKPKLKRAYK